MSFSAIVYKLEMGFLNVSLFFHFVIISFAKSELVNLIVAERTLLCRCTVRVTAVVVMITRSSSADVSVSLNYSNSSRGSDGDFPVEIDALSFVFSCRICPAYLRLWQWKYIDEPNIVFRWQQLIFVPLSSTHRAHFVLCPFIFVAE